MAGGREHREKSRPAPGAVSALLADLARAPPDAEAWAAALRPGAVVGRFELVRELGRGGFGIVWEARDRTLGRAVAFKALRRPPAIPDVAEERLLREAEAAACLSHPNVVTLHDVGRAPEGPYLVFELLRGETLQARLERAPVPPAEALRVALEVARGVAHAHAAGIVHRDLKPGNVFLCDEGRVKVLDLGLAHAFGRRRLDGGTPGYMAPEQARGAPEDERTDVFALGAILFRMLAGAPPPSGGIDGAAIMSDLPGPPGAAELVARLLARDPVDRPRDAAEVAAALAPLVGGAAPPSPEPGARGDAPRGAAGPDGAPVRRKRARVAPRRVLTLALGVVVVAALAIAAVAVRRPPARAAPPSVAVLPFADLSPARDQEYFSDGVAEEILDALSRVPGLRVTGRTSSFSFKGSAEDVRAIGRRLGVDSVLEGSVRRAGARARITAKIVSVSDGFTVWSQSYDRDVSDVFAVQEEIARAVVAALEVRLAPHDAPSVASHRTARPEVYDAYLAARRLLQRGDGEGYAGAVPAYEKVLALDPGYAPAWADLAEALFWATDTTADSAAAEAGRRRAVDAADRAVALDPGLAAGWRVRGYLRTLLSWDVDGARGDLDRALALAGSDPRVLRDRAVMALAPLGRTEEAIANLVRASELDPLDTMAWTYLAMVYAGSPAPLRGVRAAERALELVPSNPYAAFWRGAILLLDGRAREVLAASAANRGEGGARELFDLVLAALAHHALGEDRASREALDRVEARGAETGPYQIAEIHAFRGERDAAFEWLDRAFERRDAGLALLAYDPLMRGLRADPRYAALLRRMHLAP